MWLSGLEIRDLRIIEHAYLEPGPGLNLFVGPNAAGKTSILEAIHLLSTGRSFASTRAGRLVRSSGGPMRVFGRVRSGDVGPMHRLGLERGGTGQARMRVDGRAAERLSQLAHLLPVVAVHPESHRLVAGGPNERRQLLDQGLFHVEPGFLSVWQRYRRALSQRNVLLRRGSSERELEPWEKEVARSGETLDGLRKRYAQSLAQASARFWNGRLGESGRFELVYRQGWREGETLASALGRLRGREVEQRVKGVGPHRADLTFLLDGRDVRQRVSRGQQKLMVYAVRLAQVEQFGDAGDGHCVLVLDDLAAELDEDRRGVVLDLARHSGAQCFVTALDSASIRLRASASDKVFHVEQGWVHEVLY